jgi:hypothetical protein
VVSFIVWPPYGRSLLVWIGCGVMRDSLHRLMTRSRTAAIGKGVELTCASRADEFLSRAVVLAGQRSHHLREARSSHRLSRAVLKPLIDGQNHGLAGSCEAVVAQEPDQIDPHTTVLPGAPPQYMTGAIVHVSAPFSASKVRWKPPSGAGALYDNTNGSAVTLVRIYDTSASQRAMPARILAFLTA